LARRSFSNVVEAFSWRGEKYTAHTSKIADVKANDVKANAGTGFNGGGGRTVGC